MSSEHQLAPILLREWQVCGFRPVAKSGGARIPAGWSRKRKFRDNWVLLVVVEGKLELRQGAEECALTGPAMVLLKPGLGYQARAREAGAIAELHFTVIGPAHYPANPLRYLPACEPIPIADETWARRAFDLVTAERSQKGVPTQPETLLRLGGVIELLLSEYLIQAGRATGVQASRPAVPPWIADLRVFMETNFSRPTLGLQELVARSGYTATHIQREFKRHYDSSPLGLLQRFRINFACRLLRSGRNPGIAQVANFCGYRNISLFHRHFKKHTGLSPDVYRKQNEA
jgi:AraC-like DNA-binding protein